MSRNKIFYFSGTGNSLYIAEKIADKIGDSELIRITADLLKKNIEIEIENDILGIVFPVYAWAPPAIVVNFIKQIKITKNSYTFVVATHGGEPENTFKIIQKLFNQRKINLNASFDVKMPSNYIIGLKESDDEIKETLIQSNKLIDEISMKIFSKENNKIAKQKTIKSFVRSRIMNPLFNSVSSKFDNDFIVNDSCNGCGICEKVCPSENIFLNNEKKPEWKHNCSFCMACLNWCPVNALCYKNNDGKKNYYHHPSIKYTDLK
jgi:ferredoxin